VALAFLFLGGNDERSGLKSTKIKLTISEVRKQKEHISDLEFWQKRSGEKLTEEDVREITENLIGFFNTLARWERKYVPGAEFPYGPCEE
jgi:hypothetical protein